MFKSSYVGRALRLPLAVAMILTLVAIGCSRNRGPERVIVSGMVTYEGKPVAEGRIRFVPTKGTAGPVSIAKIVDGHYRADAKGGVPVATQRVEIIAYDRDSNNRDQSGNLPAGIGASERGQYLPAKYNDNSELELIVESTRDEIRKDFKLSK